MLHCAAGVPMNEIVLYNIPPSLCSQKVRLVLVEKGVPFRNRWVDIGPSAENYEPWYVKFNPKCVVPTLVNGDEVITDSLVIMRYVAENFDGPALIPTDLKEREQMEYWYNLAESLDFRLFSISTINSRPSRFGLNLKLKKLRAYSKKYPELRAEYEAKIEDISGLISQSTSPEVVKEQRAKLEGELDTLDTVLASHPFIAGPNYSLADVIWTVSLTRIEFLKQKSLIDSRPNLSSYYKRMQARSSYKDAILYPHFRLGPMLPLLARVLGPKLLIAATIVAALIFAWDMFGG